MTRARDIADSGQYVNTLDGVVATLQGVELNLLDGATITTTELNHLDGVTSAIQTQMDTKTNALTNALALNICGLPVESLANSSTFFNTAISASVPLVNSNG